jgi:hypothetical protein
MATLPGAVVWPLQLLPEVRKRSEAAAPAAHADAPARAKAAGTCAFCGEPTDDPQDDTCLRCEAVTW